MTRSFQALLPVRQVAIALFGRYTTGTRDAVYRMLNDKTIASVRDGRKWWVPAGEVDRIRNLTVDQGDNT